MALDLSKLDEAKITNLDLGAEDLKDLTRQERSVLAKHCFERLKETSYDEDQHILTITACNCHILNEDVDGMHEMEEYWETLDHSRMVEHIRRHRQELEEALQIK